jgi:2-oxoglutarate dehydrogenase E2 component (dihydrolipoamide succinyltransferase)
MSDPLEVKVPCENVNDLTAKLLAWKVASGSPVKAGDVVAELENSKATFEVTAPEAGFVEHSRSLGEEVPVGETLFCVLATSPHPSRITHHTPEPATIPPTPSPAPTPVAPSTQPASAPTFSKKAHELVTQLGVSAESFAGMAFVRESDVRQKAIELGKPSPLPPIDAKALEVSRAPEVKKTIASPSESGERVPLPRAKLLENRELMAADRAVLKCTLFFSSPAGGLQQGCARQAPPVSRLAVILFETAKLLTKFRYLNACLIEDSAFLYQHVHLGFAVDMGRGLKVLVIRNAEAMTFAELAANFESLLVKYATNTLGVPDLTGSTFTVTDLAQEGVFGFTPLINSGQAAILGVGTESEGSPAGAFMLSCSFDHRLLGGKQVAEFLRELSARLVAHRDSFQKALPEQEVLHCSRCFQTVETLRRLRAFLLPSVEPAGYICTNCLSGY